MSYVAPTIVNGEIEVEIEDEDIVTELLYWKNSLILYVLGEDLSMNSVKKFMEKMWNFVQLPDMYYHDDGYFILKFKTLDDLDAVLMKGLYTIRGMPMILKEWKPDFNMKQDMMQTILIWVKLPKIPIYLWDEQSLNKIGNFISVPLVTDECTTHRLRVSYARILVEVDITKKLVDEIVIKDKEGVKMKQQIEYEWKPKFCERCQKVGHQCDEEPKKKIRKPKIRHAELKEDSTVSVSTP